MKTVFSLSIMAALMLCVGGCSSFEEDPPPKHNSRGASDSLGAKKKNEKKEKSRRDPVDDMFFGIGKRDEAPRFSSEGLNSDERDMVEKDLRRQDEDMKALRRGHRKFDEERSKRKEWVYGFKPLDQR